MTYLLLCFGLALLVGGGELLVRGSIAVATHLKLSPLLIGLTLVGFGTSMPELVTSVEAALAGVPGIAVGNVVGSNIANILLIMGLAAIIMPVTIEKTSLKREGFALALATFLCLIFVLLGQFTLWIGVSLVMCLIAYIYIAYRQESNKVPATDNSETLSKPSFNMGLCAIMVFAGFALTILGAKFLVQSSITIATAFGISNTVIGLTVVAVGTSLPELVISVMAALRGQSALAFGNVIGSNIYNIFGILGVTAIIKPIAVPVEIRDFDIWVLALTALFLLFAAVTHKKISRLEGGLMLLAYAAYIVSLIARASS